MLDYVPDDVIGLSHVSCVQEWALSWESEAVPADGGLVLKLIAASEACCAKPANGRLPGGVFQPERFSGYCAS